MGEICQLETGDVVEVDGVTCIRISESSADDGEIRKQLKTEGSRRGVPLHSHLLSLGDGGFMAYVAQQRAKGSRRLFPQVRQQYDQSAGAPVSQWFGRWKKRKGITSPRKVLHSMRHTVSTRLKDLDVQEATIAEIVGHENQNITTGRYGKKLAVGRLRDAIELLNFREGLRNLGA